MKHYALIFLAGVVMIFGFHFSKDKAPEWTEPVNLGSMINSSYNETFPMLSADSQNLYFASNRPGGFADSTATGFEALDIYVSRRPKTGGSWEKQVHLGAPINTRYADHSVAFSPDGHRYICQRHRYSSFYINP